jgi:hypothetical protein
MTYRISEIVEFLRNLEISTDGDPEKEEAAFRDANEALAERFPELQLEDFARAIEVLKHEYEAEAEKSFQQERELARMLTLLKRHRIPSDMPWNEALRVAVSRGDEEATAYLAELESPEHQRTLRVLAALMNAAVDAHPAWSRTNREWCYHEDVAGPETPEALIDWYQLTYPREARAIEDTASQGDGHV